MDKRKRTPRELEVDRELITKGKEVLKEFDESQEICVPAKRGDTKPISVRFPNEMIKQLREIAQQKENMGYQQLIKIYVTEGISKEKRHGKIGYQPQFPQQPSPSPIVWLVTYSPQPEFSSETRFNLNAGGQRYSLSSSITEGHVFLTPEGRLFNGS